MFQVPIPFLWNPLHQFIGGDLSVPGLHSHVLGEAEGTREEGDAAVEA